MRRMSPHQVERYYAGYNRACLYGRDVRSPAYKGLQAHLGGETDRTYDPAQRMNTEVSHNLLRIPYGLCIRARAFEKYRELSQWVSDSVELQSDIVMEGTCSQVPAQLRSSPDKLSHQNPGIRRAQSFVGGVARSE